MKQLCLILPLWHVFCGFIGLSPSSFQSFIWEIVQCLLGARLWCNRKLTCHCKYLVQFCDWKDQRDTYWFKHYLNRFNLVFLLTDWGLPLLPTSPGNKFTCQISGPEAGPTGQWEEMFTLYQATLAVILNPTMPCYYQLFRLTQFTNSPIKLVLLIFTIALYSRVDKC